MTMIIKGQGSIPNNNSIEQKTKKNKSKIFAVLSLIILIASVFYWFEWRPRAIRNTCNTSAKKSAGLDKYGLNEKLKATYDGYYTLCIREKGL